MKPFFKTGLDCIDDGTECNGDCADTLYPISGNIYKARQCRMVPIVKDRCHQATIDGSPYDHFVVYGVNHAATGLAEYASITAYHYDTLSGLVSKSSEDGYAGSADRFSSRWFCAQVIYLPVCLFLCKKLHTSYRLKAVLF